MDSSNDVDNKVFADRTMSSLNVVEFTRAVSQIINKRDHEKNSSITVLEVDSTKSSFAMETKEYTFRTLLYDVTEEITAIDANGYKVDITMF